MPYNPITNNEIQVKQPLKQELFQKIKDNFDYFYGQQSISNNTDIFNNSFEIDSDNDGQPDGWTVSLYPNGSSGYETTNPMHGSKSYKFIHPGGTGNGGGYITSDYFPVHSLTQQTISLLMYCTNPATKVIIQVLYYTANKTYISTSTLYNSTNNPSQPTLITAAYTPPSNARFAKVRLIGGYTDTDQAGTIYFDYVTTILNSITTRNFESFTMPEYSTNNINWQTLGSAIVNFPIVNIPVIFTFQAKARMSGNGSSGYVRYYIGSSYSNEQLIESSSYITNTFTLQFTPTSVVNTIFLQASTNDSNFMIYVLKDNNIDTIKIAGLL